MNKLFISLAFVFLSACKANKTQQAIANEKLSSPYTLQPASIDGIGKFYFGREIAQVMGAAGGDWLERTTRQQEEDANAAIHHLPLQLNSVVADIGAGTGYYTFRIAPLVPQGKIFAIEIQDEFIKALEDKKKVVAANNVGVIKGTEKTLNLAEASTDVAIMVDVYHELTYPHEILQSVYKALKPNGKLILIEYKAEDASVAIKPLHKMTVLQTNKELKANGFSLMEAKDFLPIQHFLVYTKN